jgi:hypothetical protein
MLQSLVLLLGCVAFYLIFWSIKKVIAQFRPHTLEKSKTSKQELGSVASTLADAWLNSLPVNFHQSLPMQAVEVDSVCTETVEAISVAGEGVQVLLEGAGEQLSGLGEHIGNIISGA